MPGGAGRHYLPDRLGDSAEGWRDLASTGTMEKASYEAVVKIRSSLEDLMARMLALKRDGQNVKGSLPMREIVTDASVLFIDLRRVSSHVWLWFDRY